ncbi:MAG: hypothetical protein ACFFA3_15595 [Promethearchaeota archaeon]
MLTQHFKKIRIVKRDQKNKQYILIILFFSIFLIPILTIVYNNESITDFNERESPIISSNDVNGRYLPVIQHANISKSFSEGEFPSNVSFNLAPGWTSKNVTISYSGLSTRKDWVSNGEFDSDMNGWTYESLGSEWSLAGYGSSGNPGGCLKFRVSGGVSKGDYSYFEQNVAIPEEFASGTARLSIDYYIAWTSTFNGSIFISLVVDNVEKNKTVHLQSAPIMSWESLILSYDPLAYGQVLPGDVSLRIGVYTWEADSVTPWNEFYFDNIKCELETKPNIPNIIYVKDNEFNQNYSYINTSFGEGYSFIDTERYREVSDDIIFTIYQNISDVLDLNIDTISIHSPSEKSLNSSVLGVEGSCYEFGTNISWYTELSISSIPPDYTSWVELEKPTDWFFTSIIDGYEADRTSNCFGKEFGSPKLIIPSGIIGPGLWKLSAISQNYISESSLFVWNGIGFEITDTFNHDDKFKISVSLNSTISLQNTVINCSIFYPNGTLLLHQTKEPLSYNLNFGNYTVGKNMTVGEYLVKLKWLNSQSSEFVDEVGYSEFIFTVWHNTTLTAVDSYIERLAGDPCLIKVNYTDYDFKTYIPFATVTYNSTFGQSGVMDFIGTGPYILDLDTSDLELGDYYFSFNASKDFYQSQTSKNLIHLKIMAQPLTIEVPDSIITGMGNDYVSCRINVTGLYSSSLIWPVNITTDWENPYTVTDHNNGTYTLNFSTSNLPTRGMNESFTVKVFASKKFYGSASRFITMEIHPIQATIGVNNSIILTDLGDKIYFKVNYTEKGSMSLIDGAICSITWPDTYTITFEGQEFVICLDTSNLTIATYTAFIKLEKPGFETVYSSVTVYINRIEIKVQTIDFEDSIKASIGETLMIRINLTEMSTGFPIENASVFYSCKFGLGYFTYVSDGIYELELTLPKTIDGNYRVTLIILKEGSVYKTKEFSFFISISTIKKPDYTMWYIITGLVIILGILGIFSLRTYVVVPYRRKKQAELLAKTQRYKDIMNIEAIVISNRLSGLHIYSKSYYLIKDHQNELLSGFIQAITLISSEIVGKERLEEIKIKSDKIKGVEKIIELDFKHFNFFISDYKDIRIIFILKEKASDRFKSIIAEFLSNLDGKFANKFKNWTGDLEEFSTVLPSLINKHFQLFYREHFKINPILNTNRISKDEELNKLEIRLLNVVISMTKNQEEFYLEDALETIHEKNRDKLIEALEALITKKILIPS